MVISQNCPKFSTILPAHGTSGGGWWHFWRLWLAGGGDRGGSYWHFLSRSQGPWPAHSAQYSPPTTLLPFWARWFSFWRALLHAVTGWAKSSTQPQLWQRCLQTLRKDPWGGTVTLGLRTTALKGGCGWEHGRADRCFRQGGESTLCSRALGPQLLGPNSHQCGERSGMLSLEFPNCPRVTGGASLAKVFLRVYQHNLLLSLTFAVY